MGSLWTGCMPNHHTMQLTWLRPSKIGLMLQKYIDINSYWLSYWIIQNFIRNLVFLPLWKYATPNMKLVYLNGHSILHKLCRAFCQHTSVHTRIGIHTGFAPADKKRDLNLTSHTCIDKWMTNCQLITKTANYLCQMYPTEPEIRDTMGRNTSASFVDLLQSIGMDGQTHTSLYGKRDNFNFHTTNVLFLSSN